MASEKQLKALRKARRALALQRENEAPPKQVTRQRGERRKIYRAVKTVLGAAPLLVARTIQRWLP